MINEKDLRRYHRSAGIILAVFIIIQAFSGIILSLKHFFGFYILDTVFWNLTTGIHYRFGVLADIYRVLLGIGLLWMAVSGVMIWNRIRLRNKVK
jgi:hypothetical protein